jgi:hypothetical protein
MSDREDAEQINFARELLLAAIKDVVPDDTKARELEAAIDKLIDAKFEVYAASLMREPVKF